VEDFDGFNSNRFCLKTAGFVADFLYSESDVSTSGLSKRDIAGTS
jgi:hypothetical protein